MSDKVPANNSNPDAGSIPGFNTGQWTNARGDVGKVMQNDGDPISTHLHRHPDGLTITTYVNGVPTERYNLNTGEQEKG